MPPKSSNKKSGSKAAAIWYYCEKCEAHIMAQDRDNHDEVCPITMEHDELKDTETPCGEYIRKGFMATSSLEMRKFDIESLQDMPRKYVNNMLFISEGAIRLAGWHIGQSLLITSAQAETTKPLIRSVWPIPDKFLTTVFSSEQDFNNNWSSLKGQRLHIKSLPQGQPLTAKCVYLHILSTDPEEKTEFNNQQLRDVGRLLKAELKNLLLTIGTMIHVNFFNMPLTLEVIACNSNFEKQNSLEESFNKLKLSENLNIYKIVPDTKVEVTNDTDFNEENEASNVDTLTDKEDIGGLSKQLTVIEEAMDYALGFREMPKGIKCSRGLLIYGSSGCGKSMICEAMCTKLINHQRAKLSRKKPLILKLNASELFSKFLGETEKNLLNEFERVFNEYPEPSLIIIEEIHNLCPRHENNEISKRVAVAFFGILDSLAVRREAKSCFILATTSNIDLLNPSLRRCGRLDCEVEVSAPTPEGRREILKCMGFVGADLANLIYNAVLKAINRGKENCELTVENVKAALVQVKPSAMREVLIECPNVRWTDIGGQEELKLQLKQAIEWPLKHAEQFKRLGIKPPRGILMYGPPGCSKTMIAKALATESQLNFLSIKGPELFSMWVGESERAVREVFRKARQVSPAIVFFDEIDAIGGERAEGSSAGSGSSVKERVLTQLLTEMDGVESLENVTIVAATNRPDMIDKALLRPGRIDRIIYVGLPDEVARREIFRIKLKKMPLDEDVNLEQLVERTEGYSGAEIQAVCHEAALKTLQESFDSTAVRWSQFEYALNVVQPRTSPELLRLYDEYRKKP